MIAALAQTPTRRIVVSRWMLPAAAAAVLVAGPVYLALLGRLPAFLALYETKMGVAETLPWAAGVVRGLASLGEQALSVVLPGGAVALLLFWRGWLPRRREAFDPAATIPPSAAVAVSALPTWGLRFVALCPLAYLGTLGVLVLAGLSTQVAAHHLLVVSLGLVPLVGWLAGRPGVGRLAPRLFIATALALCLVSLGALIHFTWDTAQSCRGKCNIVLPYRTYAEGLRAAGFSGGTLVQVTSVHRMPLANLRQEFPDSRLVRPLDTQAGVFAPPRRVPPGDCVIVWEEGQGGHSADSLRAALGLADTPADPWRHGRIPGTLALSGRPAPTLSFALLPQGGALCP